MYSADSDVSGIPYRARYNPAFLRRVREKQQRRAAAELRRKMEEERRARKAKEAEERARAEAERRAREEEERAREATAILVSQFREIEIVGGKKSVRQIICDVAIEHGVRVDDILGVTRNAKITKARHAAIYRARQERPDMSLPQIGRVFRRDHTSILHAIRKIENSK